ncbi:MAG: GDSL-type esterase/lipase family protein [Parafilimonas sp.]
MTNKIILLAVFVGVFILMSFLRDTRSKKKKVIFFGDSITQVAVEPGGYITAMKDNLQKEGITDYELIGAGISGNKIYDLYLRMREDVIAQSPDIVVIYEGVNDVWHKTLLGTGTDADKYEKFYRAVIKELLAGNIKIMLCTPAAIGEKKDCTNPQDGDLNKYCNIIKAIAADFNLPVCDLRTIFLNYEQEHNPQNLDKGILTVDGVHPDETGNRLVAQEMWKVIKEIK